MDEDVVELGEAETTIFLSYSRRNRESAQRIADVLRERHFEVFRDTDDILPTEEWRGRLEQLIAEADTIVFLLSPHSVKSEVCAWEVEYATALQKRIAPIVIDEVEGKDVPPLIARLNFIFCTERDRFEDAVDSLVSALNTDIEWIREHTRLAGLASRWSGAGRPSRLLLRGQDIVDAELWRDTRPSDGPLITSAQLELITQSRIARMRRLRGMVAAALMVATITVGLAVLAFFQRETALENERIAKSERNATLLTQSRLVADIAQDFRRSGDIGNAVALARAVLPGNMSDNPQQYDRPLAVEAVQVLYDSIHGRDELRTFRGHEGEISGLAVLSEGRFLSWSTDGSLRIWMPDSGNVGPVLLGHEGAVRGAVQLSNGRVLSWGDDGTLRFWDPRSGTSGDVLGGGRRPVDHVLELTDGRILTFGPRSEVTLWDPAFGTTVRFDLRVDQAPLPSNAWGTLELSGGQVALWGLEGTVSLWDPSAGTHRRLEGHPGQVHGALQLADGRLLTWGEYGVIRAWEAETGDLAYALGDEHAVMGILTAEGPEAPISGVIALSGRRILAWSRGRQYENPRPYYAQIWNTETATAGPELLGLVGPPTGALELRSGQILTWGSGPIVQIWDAETGSQALSLRGHRNEVRGAHQLSDGRILTWSEDGSLYIWDDQTGAPLKILRGHEGPVLGAMELAGDRLLTWSADGSLRVWHAGTRSIRSILDQPVTGALLLRDSRLLTWASSSPLLRIWRGASLEPGLVLRGHDDVVAGAHQLGDGRILSWSYDGTAKTWDSETGKIDRVLSGFESAPLTVLEMGDGRVAFWDSSFAGRVWDPRTGEVVSHLQGHTDLVWGALQLANGRLLSWSSDLTARIWEPDVGTAVAVLDGHVRTVRGALQLVDGRIATWSDRPEVQIWDEKDGSLITVLAGHAGNISPGVIQLSDGRLMTMSEDNTARLWAEGSLEPGLILSGHEKSLVGGLELDDGQILTWSWDGTARIWNAETGEVELVLRGHHSRISGALSLAGGKIVTWSSDSFDAPSAALLWTRGTSASGIVLERHENGVWNVIEIADGWLLTTTGNGVARDWPGNAADAAAWADGVIAALDPLTTAERCDFYLERDEVCADLDDGPPPVD